jgi:hypothetical protein
MASLFDLVLLVVVDLVIPAVYGKKGERLDYVSHFFSFETIEWDSRVEKTI